MKRALTPDELALWSKVAATVRPAPGRKVPKAPAQPAAGAAPQAESRAPQPSPVHLPKRPRPLAPPDLIEPGRRRRIVRERDPIDGRIDLHGMTFDQAKTALEAFIRRSAAEGARAVLVITGKGSPGEGLLKQWTPEWLAQPALRPLVAGVSAAHRRHGGEGALYVALKRPPPR